MKRIILTIFAVAAFVMTEAQSLTTYYMVFPNNADTTVENIFVADFEKADPLAQTLLPQFGKTIADGIKGQIRMSERYGNVEYIPQSWRRTDIYNVAEDKADAQWVVTGTFDITTDEKRDVKAEIKNETATDIKYNIPFEAVYYDYANSINAKVKMELKDKKGNVIVSYEKEQAKESNPKRDMRQPGDKLTSHEALANSTSQFFIMDISNQFLPWLKAIKYDFRKIKNRDMKDHVSKDRYKELRDMLRDEKDMARKLDYYGLGQLYKTIAEETNLQEAYINLAFVYEVLGNYTQAREIYEAQGYTSDAERIDIFVRNRNKLKAFGKDYFEPEI